MDAGRLDRKITIAAPTYGSDDYGMHAEPSWATVASVWAKVDEGVGSEQVSADQRVSRSLTTFTINFRSGITVKQRITYNSKNYNIESVQEVGYRAYLTLIAEVVQ